MTDAETGPATEAGAGNGAAASHQQHVYRLLRIVLATIRLGPVIILGALVVAMTLLSPVFMTTGNIGNVLAQTAAIAVLAIGQLLVIVTRGIDLSVGSVAAFAGIVVAMAMRDWSLPWWLGILLGLADFEVVRHWQEVLCPLPIPLLDSFCNRFLVKTWPFNMAALSNFIVAQPVARRQPREEEPLPRRAPGDARTKADRRRLSRAGERRSPARAIVPAF